MGSLEESSRWLGAIEPPSRPSRLTGFVAMRILLARLILQTKLLSLGVSKDLLPLFFGKGIPPERESILLLALFLSFGGKIPTERESVPRIPLTPSGTINRVNSFPRGSALLLSCLSLGAGKRP